MSVIFIANIGERDVSYNIGSKSQPNIFQFAKDKVSLTNLIKYLGLDATKTEPGARQLGEAILLRLDQDKDEYARVDFPILRPVLEILQQRDSHCGSRKTVKLNNLAELAQVSNKLNLFRKNFPDKIILVATDQPESEKLRNKDTVYSAQIVRRLIIEKFRLRPAQCVVTLFQQGNPARYDETYDFYGKLLATGKNPHTNEVLFDIAEVDHICVATSGGTPALSYALLTQSFRLYLDRCVPVSTVPPGTERQGHINEIQIVPFIRDIFTGLASQMVGRYDYNAALLLLEKFSSIAYWDDKLPALLTHAGLRRSLNFTGAAAVLAGYEADAVLHRWRLNAMSISDEISLEKLAEVYYTAEMHYIRGEFLDLLWRITAFYENMLCYMASVMLGLPALLKLDKPREDMVRPKFPKLADFLCEGKEVIGSNKRVKRISFLYSPGVYRRNYHTYRAMCEWAIEKLGEHELQFKDKWHEIFDVLTRLSNINEMRNDSIHNLCGVSENDLVRDFVPHAKICQNHRPICIQHIIDTMYHVLQEVAKLSGVTTPGNPYEEINTNIYSMLDCRKSEKI